jgi:surface antigen
MGPAPRRGTIAASTTRMGMKTTLGAAVVTAAITLAAAPCGAAGWGAALGQGPTRDFNDEDLGMLLEAMRQSVEAPGEPQPAAWRNERTGAGGTLQVIGRPLVTGYAECRRVRVALYSKKQTGTPARWTTCKDGSGRWVLVAAG